MKRFPPSIASFLFAGAILALGQGVPPLINYQGRLTDAAGAPLPDGAYRIAFKLWNDATNISVSAPTHLIWGREYDVTLIQGAFNVILGANGGLAVPGAAVNDLSFALGESNRFLGLTIAQTPTATIAPNQQREILPRQQLLSVPFAVNAATAASVLPGSITTASLTPGLIQTTNLADGVVTLPKLAPRQIGTNFAGLGGIAFSRSTGELRVVASSTSETAVTNLSLTLVTTGRPVLVFLSSVEPVPPVPVSVPSYGNAFISVGHSGYAAQAYFNVYRSTTLSTNLISRNNLEIFVNTSSAFSSSTIIMPPSCIQFIDSPPPGTNSYSVTIRSEDDSTDVDMRNVRLVALEL